MNETKTLFIQFSFSVCHAFQSHLNSAIMRVCFNTLLQEILKKAS